MAASYVTGAATSPIDLLQLLVSWLVAQGWTSDSSVSDSPGWRAHLHKNGLYVNLRAAMSESIWNYNYGGGYGIGVYLGTGYSGASNWRSQAGGPVFSGSSSVVGAGVCLGSGAVPHYHFFDDGNDNIVVVVEWTTGVFGYLGWGPSMTKTGYTMDYPYFFGSMASYYNTAYPSSGKYGYDLTGLAPTTHQIEDQSGFFVRIDSAVWASQWISNVYSSTNTASGYTGRRIRSALASTSLGGIESYTPNYVNVKNRSWPNAYPGAMLLPLHAFSEMATARWAPIGYVPTVFATWAWQHGFNVGEIWQVGGLDYMVFPYFAVRKAA